MNDKDRFWVYQVTIVFPPDDPDLPVYGFLTAYLNGDARFSVTLGDMTTQNVLRRLTADAQGTRDAIDAADLIIKEKRTRGDNGH